MNAADEGTRSIWMNQVSVPDARPVKGELQCDTVVIGAGIAGLSLAYEIAANDQTIAVVDRGVIAGGMTSRTTAHLAPICDDGIASLIRVRGEEMARLFHESQAAAVDRIEEIVGECEIDCDCRRIDAYLFPDLAPEPAAGRKQNSKEYEAAQSAGVNTREILGVPLNGLEQIPALLYQRQATFHPLKYVSGLITAIEKEGGRLFGNTAVTGVEETDNGVRASTNNGSIIARNAVVATNAPSTTAPPCTARWLRIAPMQSPLLFIRPPCPTRSIGIRPIRTII